MDKWKTYRDIETVHWPKQYDGTKKSLDDIALAKIKTPFTFGITAMPACLPTAEYVSDYGEDLAVSDRILVNDWYGSVNWAVHRR